MHRQFLESEQGITFFDFIKWFNVKNIDSKDSKGRTMLHYAAAKGDQFIV